MKVSKWSFKDRKYNDIEVDSDKYYSPLYTDNMNEIVNCISCKQEHSFGSCYTSRQYHSHLGFGYPVCEKCYNKEIEQEFNSK